MALCSLLELYLLRERTHVVGEGCLTKFLWNRVKDLDCSGALQASDWNVLVFPQTKAIWKKKKSEFQPEDS